MPMPVSETEIRQRESWSEISMAMRPFSGVYLMALSRRFEIMRWNGPACPRMRIEAEEAL